MTVYDQNERIKLERSIIGGILLEGKFNLVNDILVHSDFLKPNNLIYTAFLRLYEANEPIDLLTVYRLLEKKQQPVTAYYLAECTTYVNSWSHIHHWCLILLEYNLDENLKKICGKYLKGTEIDAALASNCLQKIFESTDSLKMLELISAYLHKRSPESPLTKEIINLNQKFDERCNKIRQNLKK